MSYMKEKLVARAEELTESEHFKVHEAEILACQLLIDLVNKELAEIRRRRGEEEF